MFFAEVEGGEKRGGNSSERHYPNNGGEKAELYKGIKILWSALESLIPQRTKGQKGNYAKSRIKLNDRR